MSPSVTGALLSQKARNTEPWCFLCSQPEKADEQTIEGSVGLNAKALMWITCNDTGGNWMPVSMPCVQHFMDTHHNDKPMLHHWGHQVLIHLPLEPHMRPCIGSALVQIMACRLFGAKSLSKPTSIGPLGTNLSEILIKIRNFSFTKMHLKISFVKWRPSCPGGDELIKSCTKCVSRYINFTPILVCK